MSAFQFNARTVEPDAGRIGAIPAAWYPVAIDESELKPTSHGDGAYLNFRFTVLDGPYKGTKVYHKFNTKNANEKTVEIAYKQLSAVMHAIGVLDMTATDELHNKPLFVKLKITPADGIYDAKNEITAFRNINDAAAKQSYQNSVANPAAVAAVAAVKPPPVAAAPSAPAATWQASAAPQPWNNGGGAPASPNVPPAATATAPGSSTASPSSAPASAPAPTWGSAPAAAVQAQPTTTAPSPAVAAAQPQAGEIVPPWMRKD